MELRCMPYVRARAILNRIQGGELGLKYLRMNVSELIHRLYIHCGTNKYPDGRGFRACFFDDFDQNSVEVLKLGGISVPHFKALLCGYLL